VRLGAPAGVVVHQNRERRLQDQVLISGLRAGAGVCRPNPPKASRSERST
jgi:hypothetical protein